MKIWFGLFLLVIVILITCISYPYLPEQIGVHWNYKGITDAFADKNYAAFLFPGIMLGVYILGLLLPNIDPRKDNYTRFEGTYSLIINGILLFVFLFHVVHIASSLEIINPKYAVPELIGLLFIFIGNLSPKFKPNYFLGIRTPWTLANEDVWKKHIDLVERFLLF